MGWIFKNPFWSWAFGKYWNRWQEKWSQVRNLPTPTQPHKNGPWACDASLRRHKALIAYAGLLAWCWNILHYFRFNLHAFVLLKHVSHVAPGQPHCCSCSWQGESDVLFLQHAGRAYRPWPCLGHGVRPTGHGDQHTLLKLTLCCLFLHEQCSPSSACANGLTRGTAALGGGELFL